MAAPFPKYKTAEELQAKIDDYFLMLQEEARDDYGNPRTNALGRPLLRWAEPPTVTGLARHLGFKSRQALMNYQAKAAYRDVVERAKTRVEEYAEGRLFDRDGTNGAQFSLRHNFRWTEGSTDDSELQKIRDVLRGVEDGAKQ